jgi:hypothetical protein
MLEQPISSAEVPEADTMAADMKIRIAILYAMVKVVDAGLVENLELDLLSQLWHRQL